MLKPFVIGINGSPKPSGLVGSLLKTALSTAKRLGANVRQINLVDYKILPHTGKLNPKKYLDTSPDDVPDLQKLILQADAVIFATPTHWFGQSSQMKLFLDRLTALEDYDFLLEGKVAGFITYGPQGGALNNAMQLMMIANHWGMISPPYACIFDEGRKDPWVIADCKLLGKNIVQLISSNKKSGPNWGYPGNKYKVSPIELL